MAITAYGFDGSLSEAGWAALSVLVGSPVPAVSSHIAYQVAGGGSGDRPVTVAAGRSFAHGISTISDGPVVLNASAVVSGTQRYDTVALRYNWTANTVTPVIVTGGTTAELAASLNDTPGTLYDQPLAIVRVLSGSLTVSSIFDMRNWGTKSITVDSELALPPSSKTPRGTVAQILTTSTSQPADEYVLTSSGWVKTNYPTRWETLNLASGLTRFGPTPLFTRIGGIVYVVGGVQRSNGNPLSTNGNSPVTIGTLPVGYRPGRSMYFSAASAQSTSSDSSRLSITADGVIQVGTVADSTWSSLVCNFVAEG